MPRRQEREAYSAIGICCSMSRQALIFKRRQTQQSDSDCSVAPFEPQTRHWNVFRGFGSNSVCPADSRIAGSTPGISIGGLERIAFLTLLSRPPAAVIGRFHDFRPRRCPFARRLRRLGTRLDEIGGGTQDLHYRR